MIRFAAALALGLFAANLISADEPKPITTAKPAVIATPPAMTVVAAPTFTTGEVIMPAPAAPARRGLFSRLRNRGTSATTTMSTVPYSTTVPVTSTGTTVVIPPPPAFSGTVITNPGTVVPNPMPVPKPLPATTKPGGTSIVLPSTTTVGAVPASVIVNNAQVMPMTGTVIPANGIVTTTSGVTTASYVVPMTTTTTARRGLFGRLRNR